jgi:hypothetical protein
MKEYKDQFPEALSRMFPTIESYEDFKNNNAEIASKIILKLMCLAYTYNHIPDKTEHDLIKLVNTMALTHITSQKKKISFSETMDNIAQDKSINNLVEWLNLVAADLDFPKIQASMI